MVQVEEVDEMTGVLPPQRPIFRGRTVLPRFVPKKSKRLTFSAPCWIFLSAGERPADWEKRENLFSEGAEAGFCGVGHRNCAAAPVKWLQDTP